MKSERHYTYYRESDGDYVKTLSCPDEESADLNLEPGTFYLSGNFGPNSRVENGVPVHIKDEAVAKIEDLRSVAVASREQVLLYLGPKDADGVGVLTEDEVMELSSGQVAANLVAGLKPKDRLEFKMGLRKHLWERNGKTTLQLAQILKLDDKTLDEAFNVGNE